MEKNTEFLNFIHQNAEMGSNTLSQLEEIVTDDSMRASISKQLQEYNGIMAQAEKKLDKSGKDIKEVSKMLQVTSSMMINMKTMKDKSNEHIAEMIIQGSTMGIIDITKKIKEYATVESDNINLAYRLMWVEQKNCDELKRFL